MLRSLVLAAVSIAVAAVAVGCPGIGDIDRTQPDKVKKSTFFNADGTPAEYYFRQTIIDVPATNGVTFIGEQGDTERVIFEVTENILYVYRSYGFLQNDSESGAIPGNQGDEYNRPGSGPYHGSPIAAFPIVGHFDVQRQYNPATGEQTNVIYEDYADRPWYQREYIRVNWATNLIADFRFGAAQVAQLATTGHYVPSEDQHLDTENTNRPIITPEYIDTVTELDVLPEYYDLSYYGYGLLPQCYFYSTIYKDCFGGTIKVRNSFMRVGERDYMPLDYDDLRFQKFGYFRTERPAYNDEYGVVEPAQIRLANRHNIWRNAASCYDADADLPYGACSPSQLKPIVYHLNEDFPRNPPELLQVVRNNADEWNRVLTEAVVASTGFDPAQVPRMFFICENNPVIEGDPAECGPAGTNPQMGDLRYSMYYYVPNFQFAPPLGYGPSAADPLTGEIIQGNAFYYGAAGATIAARTRDAIKLQLGLLTDEDITGGLPAQEAVAAARTASSAASSSRFYGPELNAKALEMAQNLRLPQKMDRIKDMVASGQAMHDKRPGRLERLKQSGADEILLNDEIREVFGPHLLEEGLLGSNADPVLAARLFDDEALFRREIERKRRLLTPAARGCILSAEDVFDDGLLGLASQVKQKFYDTQFEPPILKEGFTDDDVYNFILAQTMGDTQLHEIGHTVGLRHNFAGSTDALNYGPKYWDIRGRVRPAGSERPVPEWDIAGNLRNNFQQALDSGLRDNQDSTVMDYASTYGTSLNLGLYDLAAIKYAYGDVVEVFNSPDINQDKAQLLRAGELHYLYYPEVVSNKATYEERIADLYDRSHINFRKTGGENSAVEVPYAFCSDEYRDASATCAIWDQGADNFERTVYAAEHYRNYALFNHFKRQRLTFGLDVFGYLARVYTVDFTYMLNQYKNWVNDEFIVRDNKPCLFVQGGNIVQSESPRFVAQECGLPGFLGTVEAVNMFAEILQQPDVGCYVRLKPGCYDTVASNGDPLGVPDDEDLQLVDTNPDACDGYTPAQPDPEDPNADRRVALKVTAQSSYNHVPLSTSCEGYALPGNADLFETPIELGYSRGGARPSNTLYDREQFGYYFYVKPIVIGSWWDKWMAVKALNDPNTDFIGVDAASDPKAFLISMNTLFGDQVNDLVGATITENVNRYAPVLDGNNVTILPLLDIATGGSFDRSNITLPILNPAQQYTFRLLALFNASYSGQYTDDFEFAESIVVGSAYNNSTVDFPPEVLNDPTRYAEVTDPVTGIKWYALNQRRDVQNNEFYSIGYQFIREIKQKYYVGGADGPGNQLLPGFQGTFSFLPRNEIEILRIMQSTAGRFGWADVWEGDLSF